MWNPLKKFRSRRMARNQPSPNDVAGSLDSDGLQRLESLMNSLDVTENDALVDCGANVGNVTAVLARFGAVVYAFEPNPFAFSVLSERFKTFDNVVCLNQAVFTRDCTLPLYFHENSQSDPVKWSTGSSVLPEKSNVVRSHSRNVEAVDFAKFLAELDRPVRFIKMDIEGAEYDVLDHLIDQRLVGSIGRILVETHVKKIPSLAQKDSLLRAKIEENGISNIDLSWV